MPTPNLRLLLLASVLLAPFAARAQVAAASPFMPPQGSGGTNAPTADAPLEFRGLAEMPDGPAFRVVDPARKRGAWVKLNERDADLGVMVKQHDAEHETVTVEQQGRTFTLSLHQSKISSSGAAMMTAAVVPQMQVPTIAAMAQQAAAPLQQSQLDAVTAAVAQRRALRDQAAQQINQGGRVAPQVIPPQPPPPGQNAAAPAQTQNGRNGGNGQKNNPRQNQP